MDSSKNGRWMGQFKKFCRLSVNMLMHPPQKNEKNNVIIDTFY